MFNKIHSDEIMYKVARTVTKTNKENVEVRCEYLYKGNLSSCRNYMAKKAIKTWKEGKKKPSWCAHFLVKGKDSITVRVDRTYNKYTTTTFEIV